MSKFGKLAVAGRPHRSKVVEWLGVPVGRRWQSRWEYPEAEGGRVAGSARRPNVAVGSAAPGRLFAEV